MSKGLDSTRSIWHAQNFCSYLSIGDNGDYLDMLRRWCKRLLFECSNSFVLLARFHALVFFESCHCHLACEYSRFSFSSPLETSMAARSKKKRLYSQARSDFAGCIFQRFPYLLASLFLQFVHCRLFLPCA